MISINSNQAAMVALQSLEATQQSMQTTQQRISTGLKVGSASDNAAYWSIATTMRTNNSALSAVSDSLNLGASTIGVATNGLNSAITVVQSIQAKLVAAQTPGVDRTAIQSDITQLQKQLKSIADSASFSGQNWLSIDSSANGGNTTKSIVSSYQNGATSTISIDAKNIALFDANSSTGTTTYNVSFAAGTGLASDLGTKYASAATGDTATVTLDIGSGQQAATATKGATGWTVSYASTQLVDSTSTPAKTTSVKLDGSTTAADTVDFTASGVVSKTTDYTNTGDGILSKLGNSGVAIAQFDNAGNLQNSIDVSKLTDSSADQAKLAAYIKDTNAAIGSMTTAASNLGSVQSRVTTQQTFIKSLMDSLTSGISSLVDADMTQESTKLSALQVQQQLGTQAMSIANQSTQSILSLFHGG